MNTAAVTIISGIILYLIGVCLHYRGKYYEAKNIAEKLSDYIAKIEETRAGVFFTKPKSKPDTHKQG